MLMLLLIEIISIIAATNKYNDFKAKFRPAGNSRKRVSESVKFTYPNKRKASITSQKFGFSGFCRIANTFPTKLFTTGLRHRDLPLLQDSR